MTQFIALRTWTSSNGGWVRFIVRYHVRSPEFWWKYGFRLGSVEYFFRNCGGMLVVAVSYSPASILLQMSSAFALTTNWNSSGKFSRAAFVSVFGVVVRVADEVEHRLAVEAARRLDLVARRDVDLVRALDHVRAGRDEVAAVRAGLALEALRRPRPGSAPSPASPSA